MTSGSYMVNIGTYKRWHGHMAAKISLMHADSEAVKVFFSDFLKCLANCHTPACNACHLMGYLRL